MQTLTIRFSIAGWEPIDLPAIGDFSHGTRMTKDLSGDLTGQSTGLFINTGVLEGARTYMVIERLEGSAEDGAESAITLEHGGVEGDDSAFFGRIVPGSGTGIFANATGTVTFDNDDEGEMMVLKFTN